MMPSMKHIFDEWVSRVLGEVVGGAIILVLFAALVVCFGQGDDKQLEHEQTHVAQVAK